MRQGIRRQRVSRIKERIKERAVGLFEAGAAMGVGEVKAVNGAWRGSGLFDFSGLSGLFGSKDQRDKTDPRTSQPGSAVTAPTGSALAITHYVLVTWINGDQC